METVRQFYQLSLPAREPLEKTFLTDKERERLEEFFQLNLREDPVLQLPASGLFSGMTREQKIMDQTKYWSRISGKDAFELFYEAGFKLVSSASTGGCRATATIEHFFIKEFETEKHLS